jgi:hypothetical protein
MRILVKRRSIRPVTSPNRKQEHAVPHQSWVSGSHSASTPSLPTIQQIDFRFKLLQHGTLKAIPALHTVFPPRTQPRLTPIFLPSSSKGFGSVDVCRVTARRRRSLRKLCSSSSDRACLLTPRAIRAVADGMPAWLLLGRGRIPERGRFDYRLLRACAVGSSGQDLAMNNACLGRTNRYSDRRTKESRRCTHALARPFRISHRGGRGQDFDRFVSVR